MPLRDPFDRQLPSRLFVKNGPVLATVADARRFILSLRTYPAEHSRWQRAMQLMLEGAPVDAIHQQLKLALLFDDALDVRRTQ